MSFSAVTGAVCGFLGAAAGAYHCLALLSSSSACRVVGDDKDQQQGGPCLLAAGRAAGWAPDPPLFRPFHHTTSKCTGAKGESSSFAGLGGGRSRATAEGEVEWSEALRCLVWRPVSWHCVDEQSYERLTPSTGAPPTHTQSSASVAQYVPIPLGEEGQDTTLITKLDHAALFYTLEGVSPTTGTGARKAKGGGMGNTVEEMDLDEYADKLVNELFSTAANVSDSRDQQQGMQSSELVPLNDEEGVAGGQATHREYAFTMKLTVPDSSSCLTPMPVVLTGRLLVVGVLPSTATAADTGLSSTSSSVSQYLSALLILPQGEGRRGAADVDVDGATTTPLAGGGGREGDDEDIATEGTLQSIWPHVRKTLLRFKEKGNEKQGNIDQSAANDQLLCTFPEQKLSFLLPAGCTVRYHPQPEKGNHWSVDIAAKCTPQPRAALELSTVPVRSTTGTNSPPPSVVVDGEKRFAGQNRFLSYFEAASQAVEARLLALATGTAPSFLSSGQFTLLSSPLSRGSKGTAPTPCCWVYGYRALQQQDQCEEPAVEEKDNNEEEEDESDVSLLTDVFMVVPPIDPGCKSGLLLHLFFPSSQQGDGAAGSSTSSSGEPSSSLELLFKLCMTIASTVRRAPLALLPTGGRRGAAANEMPAALSSVLFHMLHTSPAQSAASSTRRVLLPIPIVAVQPPSTSSTGRSAPEKQTIVQITPAVHGVGSIFTGYLGHRPRNVVSTATAASSSATEGPSSLPHLVVSEVADGRSAEDWLDFIKEELIQQQQETMELEVGDNRSAPDDICRVVVKGHSPTLLGLPLEAGGSRGGVGLLALTAVSPPPRSGLSLVVQHYSPTTVLELNPQLPGLLACKGSQSGLYGSCITTAVVSNGEHEMEEEAQVRVARQQVQYWSHVINLFQQGRQRRQQQENEERNWGEWYCEQQERLREERARLAPAEQRLHQLVRVLWLWTQQRPPRANAGTSSLPPLMTTPKAPGEGEREEGRGGRRGTTGATASLLVNCFSERFSRDQVEGILAETWWEYMNQQHDGSDARWSPYGSSDASTSSNVTNGCSDVYSIAPRVFPPQWE